MLTKNRILLDTSALLTLLTKGPGYEKISNVIATSAMSAVSLSKFISLLTKANVLENDIAQIINDLVPDIIPFCEKISIKTGKLSGITKNYQLSLSDRACLATGEYYQMEIYTSNQVWAELNGIVAPITVIR